MSSNADIETRILEMKLDNDQFEKGVRSTIQSLEDLEEKLELKDAGDGFDRVSKAANTMQFSSMERSLDAITDKFSLLGNVGLQALERISNKIVDIGENILKGITIDPLTAGWGEFELKTNSIQTILGGTRKYYKSDAEALHNINKELDALNEYADQTIYSFAQMTENVGKFTNQNIDLKTSTQAIKGIGNWAALVGADSAQMSRAMYNISQALGGGAMKLVDWKSIRFANMATPDVQKLFADIAYAQGGMKDKKGNNLKKDSKQAKKVYQSIISDFEGSLKSGWLTNDIMMNGLKVLSGEISGEDLAKLFGDSEEAQALAAQYAQIAADAKEAATSVKTFTQLVGVLQESLGSGWATTFEKLFGGFEQQKKFFTEISNIIGGFIERDADGRNSWVDRFANRNNGVLLFQDTIINIIHLLTELWGLAQDVTDKLIDPFGGIYKFFGDPATAELFGQGSEELEKNLNDTGLTAQHVAGIIADLDLAFSGLYQWFHGEKTDENGNVIEEATPAYENAVKIFAGLGSVVMIALNAIENLFRFGGRILALFEPLASSVLKLFGNVGGILYSIYQNIAGQHTFSDFFNNLYAVISPVISAIVDFASVILDLIAALFDLGTEMDATGAKAENNKLGPFIKTLSDIFESLPLLLAPVSALLTKVVGGITGFIRGVMKGFPAIKKHVKKEGVTPFQDLKDIVQEFIAEGFGEDAAKSITEWYNNNVKGTLESLVEWFGTAYDSIVTFFSELPEKVDKLVARVKAAFNAFSNYNYDSSLTPFENFKERMKQTILALFGEEVGSNIIKQYQEHIAPYVNKVAEMIESSFSNVTRTLDGITEALKADYTGIDNPFDLLQAIALNFLKGYNKDEELGVDLENKYPGVLEFFQTLSDTYDKEIKPVVDKVLGWVTTDIPNALNTVWEFLFGKDMLVNKGEGGLAHLEKEHIPGLFDNFLTWINGDGKTKLDEIVKFFSDMWTKINDALFGHDILVNKGEGGNAHLEKEHVPGVFENILNWAKTDGQKIIDEITNFFTEAWNTLNRILFGYDVPAGQTTTMWQGGHVNGIVDNVQNAYQRVADWCNNDGAEIVKTVTDFFLGEETETTDANGKTKKERVGGLIQDAEKFWNDYGSTAWESIKTVYNEVNTWVNGTGATVVKAVTDFIFGKEDEKTKERSGGAIDAVVTWYNDNKATLEDVFTNKLPRLFTQIQTVLFGQDVPAGQTTSMWQGGHINGVIDILQESFGKLKEWAEGDGAEILKTVGDFILGKEILDENGKATGEREGGAWQAVQTFLDPIANWISEKGEKVYNYLTTHDFEEMWADLDTFLFGAKDLSDPTGQKRTGEGVLTPIMNVLQPVADFFGGVGASLLTTIQSVDFGKVWAKISEFFFGSNELALINEGSGDTYYEIQHVDGLFDRLANLLDRVITFFESDTWKGIKDAISQFWDECVKPIIDFFGTIGGSLFESLGEWDPEKGFFDNIGTILEKMSGSISTEFPKLLEKFGISLGEMPDIFGTFLGGLFPSFGGSSSGIDDSGDKQDGVSEVEQRANAAAEKNKSVWEQAGDVLASIFFSTASAEDAVTDDLSKASEESTDKEKKNKSIIEDVIGNVFGGTTAVFTGLGETIGGFIGGLTEKSGPLLTILGVGGTVGGIAKITSSIYGAENKGVIDKIAELLDALGGLIEKVVWLAGLTALVDLYNNANGTDFNPLVETLNAISSFLTNMITTMVTFSIVTSVANGFIQIGADFAEDKANTTMSADIETVSETMEGIGVGLQSLMNSVSILIDNIWKILATETALELLLGKGEDEESKMPRLHEAIKLVTECITSLVGGISWESLFPATLMNMLSGGVNGMVGGAVFKWFGLRTRTEPIANSIMAIGDVIQSVLEGVSNILNAITIMSLLTDPNDIREKIALVKDLVGVLPGVFTSIADAVGAIASYKFFNALNGLNIATAETSIAFGGAESLGLAAKVPLFASIALIVLAFADLVGIVVNRNIQRLAPTLYIAGQLIAGAINAFKRVDFGAQNNASESIKTAIDMLNKLGGWGSRPGAKPMENSTLFRDSMSNLALGFDVITRSMNGYDPKSTALVDALDQMNTAWDYFSTANEGKGFDVSDFQGKLSILQLAGQNISSISGSFRGVSEEDVSHVSTVVDFMRNVSEVAQVVSTIYGLGSLGTQMNFGYDAGLGSMMSFLEELSWVGTVSKDEAGKITGIEELDPEKIRGVFLTMIEALPDPDENKELFDKLHSFIEAGGGNLGLFVNGFTGLNRALEQYSGIMYTLGTDNFVRQTSALADIDKLGQSLTTDYKFLGNSGDVANVNTRLGLFASDLGLLAQSMLALGNNVKDINSDGGDTFGEIADFLHRINNLGAIYEIFNADDGQWYGTNEFGNHLNTFVSDFNSLQAAFGQFCGYLVKTDNYDFDITALDAAATFFERLAGVWETLGGAAGKPYVNTVYDDMYDQFIAQTDRLTRFAVALPTLGSGLKDFYDGVKEIPFDDEAAKNNLYEAIDLANEIATKVYSVIQSTSFDAYRVQYLAQDLFSTDANNPGLFNVLDDVFDAAKNFDQTGMANAKTAIESISGIIEPVRSLLQETLTGSSYRLLDLVNDLHNDKGTGMFDVMSSMFSGDTGITTKIPLTELQAYAGAFKDLSSALTMSGQAATLAGAIDEAIKSLDGKEIKLVVTPVWNMGDDPSNPLGVPGFGWKPNVTNEYSTNTIQNIQFPDVQTVRLVPEDLNAIRSTVSEAGTQVSGRVGALGTTISGLRVQLDTGVLVGQLVPEIDRRLGRYYSTPRYIFVRNTEDNP